MYSGEGLATDRESVLWLNVQEIPQSASENELQIAIRQRIKVFYRPQGLSEDPLKAAQALQWRVSGGSLEVSNPGPYHVSMIKLEARKNGHVMFQEDSRMLAPRQRIQLPLNPAASSGPLELSFISINDFGAQEPYHARVSSEPVTHANKAEPHPD
jgi:P pilus assembly chaperone PapD